MAIKTNFEVNGNKYYRVTRTIGYKSTGIPIKKVFYGKGINEANEKANDYMNKLKNGLVQNFDKLTIDEIMHYWIYEYLPSQIKPSTYDRYEGIYRNYVQTSPLSQVKIDKINVIKIQNYYNELEENGKTYSQIYSLNKVLKTFFFWCVDNDYILKNPASKIKLKKPVSLVSKSKNKAFTDEEIKLIKEEIKGSYFEVIFLFDLSTGLRLGELLALTWDDIDLINKTVSVTKNIKSAKNHKTGKWEILTQVPKTQNSIRTIPLPQNIIDILKPLKNTGLVFKNEFEYYLKDRYISQKWRKINEKNRYKW